MRVYGLDFCGCAVCYFFTALRESLDVGDCVVAFQLKTAPAASQSALLSLKVHVPKGLWFRV